MKTASGKPWIADDVDCYFPQDGALETSPELLAELRHPGFQCSLGVAEQRIYQGVHYVEKSYCRCKRGVGNRGRFVVGDRLVSVRREPEGWVLVRHVKAPKRPAA